MSKVMRLADVKFDEEELIYWIENNDWDRFGIESDLEISHVVSSLIGGEIFYCEVCDLQDNIKCSGILLGIKKESALGKEYFLVLIDAWECENSVISMGEAFLCNA